MAKSMTKNQIITHLANKTKTTKKVSAQFLDELVKLSYKEAKKVLKFRISKAAKDGILK